MANMGLFNRSKKNDNSGTPAERYLQHLNNIFQQEPVFHAAESLIEGLPRVSTIVYKDVPEKGYITGFTYGLSLVQHPAWKAGRPELCISVASEDMTWARVAGYIANELRGSCPFSYGESINFEQRISGDSEMDAFFIFAPSTLYKEDYLNIDVGTDYKINIAGLYPIYSSELPVLLEMGLEKFWHHPEFDNYSVNRNKISR